MKRTLLNISTTSRHRASISKKEKELLINNHIIDINKYELIDNKRLDSIFNSYKERINERINKSSHKKKCKLPLKILFSLDHQQKFILNNDYINKRNKNMLNFLSKKINKSKDDLIMNKIDNFLYKKELIEKIENKTK